MSIYHNTQLDRVPTSGGSVRVAIASNAGQGNGGTSLPCKEVWIIGDSGNSGTIRVKIGEACTATTGIPVPEFGTDHWILRLPIDDVASLYFYGSNNTDNVDILYRL